MLSSTIARTTAKAMFDAMYVHSPQGAVLPPSAVISPDVVAQTHVSFLGQMAFPAEDWHAAAPASHVEVVSSKERQKLRTEARGVTSAPPLPVDPPSSSEDWLHSLDSLGIGEGAATPPSTKTVESSSLA